jgi:hypothetical protein
MNVSDLWRAWNRKVVEASPLHHLSSFGKGT